MALDLETTGLDPDSDEIIEVGLVRFQGATVLDQLSTTVNPLQALTPFIQRYTGITQADVDASPPFGGWRSSLWTSLARRPSSATISPSSSPSSHAAASAFALRRSTYETWDRCWCCARRRPSPTSRRSWGWPTISATAP